MAQPTQIECYNKGMPDSFSYGYGIPRGEWSASCPHVAA